MKNLFIAFSNFFCFLTIIGCSWIYSNLFFECFESGAYVEAMDDLMESNWGKSFPAVVTLHQYVFNGYDDATILLFLIMKILKV